MARETNGTVIKLVPEDKDLLRELVRETVQHVLETEMTEALGFGQESAKREPPGLSVTCARPICWSASTRRSDDGPTSSVSSPTRSPASAWCARWPLSNTKQEGNRDLNMQLLIEQKKEQLRKAA